jgi:ABC-type transport system involved in multi-copper enzyme maturation permease subunit
MIWAIAKRELHSNIITLRFLVSLILSLALITASAYMFAGDYKVRLDNYYRNVKYNGLPEEEHLGGIKVHLQIRSGAERFPSPLGFLSIGSDKELGNTISAISFREVPREAVGQSGGNFLMDMFPSLDIALIIRVVLSLLALLLAYDAISGEREMGTLAVTLANPIPRHQVLLGKVLGGMISITIPLAAGLLTGLLVVVFYGSASLDSSAWIHIGLVFLCSLLYLSSIFMMGILVSARTRRSATSLVVLLFIWVVLVMLWPNMGSYVARQAMKVEDKSVVDTKREALERELAGEIDRFSDKQRWEAGLRPPSLYRFVKGSRNTGFSGDVPYPSTLQYLNREQMIWFLEGIKYIVPLQIEYADKVWELYRVYEEELRRQVAFSENLSRISPAWTYYNAISVLAGTDYGAYTRFMDQARRYRNQLVSYSNTQQGFTTPSFFTTMKLSDTLTHHQLEEMQSRYGNEAIEELQSSYWPKAPVLTGIPVFRHQPEPLTESIGRMLPDVTMLILLNMVFFLIAYALFVRQEVK